MTSDLRYAFRLLSRQRATALLIILTLALGIGATSAMFTVINAILLRPLPYNAPERIVQLENYTTQNENAGASAAPDYLDFKREVKAFEAIAGAIGVVVDLSDGTGDPERVSGLQVTEQFFDVFGMPAALGRTFDAAHVNADRGTTVVLSHRLWQRRFAGAPAAVGRTVRINGQTHTIIGVMPAGFESGDDESLWTLSPLDVPEPPLAVEGDVRKERGLGYFEIVARLKPAVTLAGARAETDRFSQTLAERHPDSNRNRRVRVVALKDRLVGHLRPALFVLLGAVACVLLIACANVANLLLARAGDRHREMAIRTALGAARWRLLRQLLWESVLLAIAGGLLGLVVAHWGVQLLIALAPSDVPRLDTVGVDLSVVAFTFSICVITGVLFGMAPALHTSRVTPQDVLREAGTRTAGGRQARITRSVLVVSQLALALMLVVGASLMATSFSRLGAVDPGFRSEQVVAVDLPLPIARYATPQRQYQFYGTLVERLRETPVGRTATVAFPQPLQANNANASFRLDGAAGATRAEGDRGTAALTSIATDYFRTLGIPLLQGRDFDQRDTEKSARVIVVNRAFARKYYPGQDVLDKRVKIASDTPATIVGLVGDVRGFGLDREAPPIAYLPYQQFTLPYMTVLVRTSAGAGDVANTLRGIMRQVDPEMPVDDVETLDRIVNKTIAQPRFRTTLLTAFAVAALGLAVVGVYGVISYTVAQRRREMGIRAALGATPRDLLALVMRQGLTLAAAGVLAGLAGAFALSGLLSGLLYNVAATDPTTLIAAAAALVAVAAAACAVPAWRTMKLDPLVALRDE
jgi:putative ABC transport system permease protein